MVFNKWLRYDVCGCGAAPGTACLDMRMPGSSRTVKDPHPHRPLRLRGDHE